MSTESARPSYTLSSELNSEHAAYVTSRLQEFNHMHASPLWQAPRQSAAPIQLYVLQEKDTVIGGLIGRTHAIPEWLEISVIWVAETWRQHGIGRQLIQLAEVEAKSRGCHYVRLATSTNQAPGFYLKLGYRIYGRLENCPPGETVYYFYKQLT